MFSEEKNGGEGGREASIWGCKQKKSHPVCSPLDHRQGTERFPNG